MRTSVPLMLALAFAPAAAARAVGDPLPTHADLVYATVTGPGGAPLELALDLYLPSSAPAPLPCVVWIHGGAWQSGSKFPTPAAFLAESGYAVASVRHRLSHEASWPAQLHDCKAAVRWLRANAPTWGLDPDRFGAWGLSSGAHLAALLGTTGDLDTTRVGALVVDLAGTVGAELGTSSRVQAVVDWFGPTDFLRMDLFPGAIAHDAPGSPESLLLGAPLPLVPALARTADPMRYLSADDAPVLLSHGTADIAVPFDQSEAFWRAAVEVHGLPFVFEPLPDGLHAGPGYDLDAARAWFDLHLAALPTTVSLEALEPASESGVDGGLRITRSGPTNAALEVRLAYGGEPRAGEDLAPLPLLVTLPAGASELTLPVQALDDDLVEGAEVLTACVAPSTGYRVAADASCVALDVEDDEPDGGLPVVELATLVPVVQEGGPVPGRARITRSGSTAAPLRVSFRVAGTAVPGVDHGLESGEVLLPAGSAFVDVELPPLDDSVREPAETWTLELLAGPDHARGPSRWASGRIADDDGGGALPLVALSTETVVAHESSDAAGFILGRSGPPFPPLTVRLALSGSASPGADYEAPLLDPAFPAGAAFLRLTWPLVDDDLAEGDETLVVQLLPDPTYRVGGSGPARVRLTDDEAAPPPVAPVSLRVGAVRISAPLLFTVAADPGGIWATVLAFEPGYFPLPGYPWSIGLAPLVTLGLGVLDTDGSAASALTIPDDPSLLEVELHLQALVVAGSSLELSEARRRKIAR